MRRLFAALVIVGCVPAPDAGLDLDATPGGRPELDAQRTISDARALPADAVRDVALTDVGSSDLAVADGGVGEDGSPAGDARPPPPLPECSDGEDNDEDGRINLYDSDCTSPADPRELGGAVSACANGEDDDEDGRTDFPYDPGCVAAGDPDEADPAVAPACDNGMDDDED